MGICGILPVVTSLLLAQDVQISHDGNQWQLVESGGVGSPQTRVLKVATRGHVIIRGSTGDQITYRLTERVRARTDEQAHRLFGNGFTIIRPVNGVTTLTVLPKTNESVVTQLEIGVPRRLATVIVETQPGDIEAYDLDSDLYASTVAGQIRCDDLRGGFDGSTGGGEIHLGKIGGRIRCVNGAGSIMIDNAGAAANCQSAGGEIQIREAAGPLVLSTQGGNIQVDRAGSSVEAHTSEGVIEIAQANGMVFADTRGGAIQIGSARGVRCQSAAGAVRVKTSSGPLQIQTALGSILAEVLAGARLQDSSLVAGSGDITVLIPSNVALSVLARNDSGANPRIVSEFSELRARTIELRPPGPNVYQGAIHGGGPLLTLETAAGIIYVRKSK